MEKHTCFPLSGCDSIPLSSSSSFVFKMYSDYQLCFFHLKNILPNKWMDDYTCSFCKRILILKQWIFLPGLK